MIKFIEVASEDSFDFVSNINLKKQIKFEKKQIEH